MAEEDCLSVDGTGEHAAGDTVCLSCGSARSPWRRGLGRGYRDHVLGDGGPFGSHGRSRPAAAVTGGMVAGHCFLFSRPVFFLQDADVRKKIAGRAEFTEMSARRRLQVLLELRSN